MLALLLNLCVGLGACGAALACSTCHLYVEQQFYDKLPPPDDEEEDMLDLAMHLEDK